MKYYHMISMWDLDTSNTRAGNSKQVETILNDILKGLSDFDSNHMSDQRIVHFVHIAKMVPNVKNPNFWRRSLPVCEIQPIFA